MTSVTIIGTGNMARGIATRVLAGGNHLQLLGHTAEHAEKLASELGSDAVATGTSGDAIEGDIVVFAVWYQVALPLVGQYGEQLADKIVVDITNPVDVSTFDGLVTPAGSSAAEEIAKAAPPGARVVKAFNTTFAGTLVKGEVAGQQLDVLVASDDDEAKRAVLELVESGGLRGIDAGPLRRARELEALGFLHMTVQGSLGTGYGSAVKLLG
jgi:8-hydroxy-5-deazaflavin:NADPH oxidoreductase